MPTNKQPHWHRPTRHPFPVLKVNNSMTRNKEEFVPVNGKSVSWYCCGPTVYDKSHVGHARSYIAFDILRRIMTDHFNYDVLFVMNITDIDDKIIRAARHKLLFDSRRAAATSLTPALLQEVDDAWKAHVEKNINKHVGGGAVVEDFNAFMGRYVAGEFDAVKKVEEKFELHVKIAARSYAAIKDARAALASGGPVDAETARALLDESRDPFATWVDDKEGHKITDPKVFRDFAAYWENEFFKDMDALNIRRPDVLTRVSEYVPEIVEYVKKIVENGFAYEAANSVYFDTARFSADPAHDYAKLEPWSASNIKLIEEGEGALSDGVAMDKKKNAADFALWKASKPGEPAWDSPWGMGRPGWHIECSVMASDVIGEKMDIHTGGSDLAFPHHDNELAQAESYYNCAQWVNYFLHAGHLNVEGQKMSKSLKNFVSIQDALKQHTAAQIRIMYLMHHWDSGLDYSASAIAEARTVEIAINNFLALIKAVAAEQAGLEHISLESHNHGEKEKALLATFTSKQSSIHANLCDNFNTKSAMQDLRALISAATAYYNERLAEKQTLSVPVLGIVAKYVTKMMRTFGVFGDANAEIGDNAARAGVGVGGKSLEETLMPYIRALSAFRDGVRELAQSKSDHVEILKLSDKLRDEDLVELGIVLDDREGGKALVKIVDKEFLIKQREEKSLREKEKQREKEKRLCVLAQKKLEKLKKGRSPPAELFKTAEYSAWDEQGIPTVDKEGDEVSKARRKKLEKEHGAQKKLHDDFLAAKAKGEI